MGFQFISLYYNIYIKEFQLITSTSDNSSLSLNQDTSRFEIGVLGPIVELKGAILAPIGE